MENWNNGMMGKKDPETTMFFTQYSNIPSFHRSMKRLDYVCH